MKLHALKHGPFERKMKDYLDLDHLIRVNHVDLKSDAMRRIFGRHGTPDLYEKLSRTSARE